MTPAEDAAFACGQEMLDFAITAPKRPPLPSEARSALVEIEAKLASVHFELDRLSEPALKGLAFKAREQADFETDLWTGVAAECDRKREIKSRHRTGRGIWYAVIEAERPGDGPDSTYVDEVAFEKCSGRKAAVKAVSRLLSEKLSLVDERTMLRTALYCELEWKPPEQEDGRPG
jgi:hypothetical protein